MTSLVEKVLESFNAISQNTDSNSSITDSLLTAYKHHWNSESPFLPP